MKKESYKKLFTIYAMIIETQAICIKEGYDAMSESLGDACDSILEIVNEEDIEDGSIQNS